MFLAGLFVFLCVYPRPLLLALAGFVFGLAAGVLLAAVLVAALYRPACRSRSAPNAFAKAASPRHAATQNLLE
jgi:hypothetical protein